MVDEGVRQCPPDRFKIYSTGIYPEDAFNFIIGQIVQSGDSFAFGRIPRSTKVGEV
jgi:hypothetical protein